MRITDIRCWLIEKDPPAHAYRWRTGLQGSGDGTPPGRKPLGAVVRMETDEGIHGVVEVEASQARGVGALSIDERRLRTLIGEDPTCTERLWHLIWELDRIEEFQMGLLGLADQLAWDIKSKKAGMPLWHEVQTHTQPFAQIWCGIPFHRVTVCLAPFFPQLCRSHFNSSAGHIRAGRCSGQAQILFRGLFWVYCGFIPDIPGFYSGYSGGIFT